jgi:hypothetical protein
MLIAALQSIKSKMHATFNLSDARAKIQDGDFVPALIQAVATSKQNFSLAQLCRTMCDFLGTKIGKSAFNQRLGTASLIAHLQLVLQTLLNDSFLKSKSKNLIEPLLTKLGVSEIIGIDASMVSLWDGLSKHFKGTFMNASMKLHLAVNLATGCVAWFKITSGATHDTNGFPESRPGILSIFDLGYWSMERLLEIKNNGAFFLSRVKGSAKLHVTHAIHGFGASIVGKDLLSYPISRKRESVVELLATMMIDKVEISFRVIGFWDKKSKRYRWYLTNLKAARSLIYDLYRFRWQIELSFKAMKSTLNFDRMPTLNSNAVVSFTLIALINYVLVSLLRADASKQKKTVDISIQRVAKAFTVVASKIFETVKIGKRFTEDRKERLTESILLLLSEMIDPNHRKRKTTVGRLLAQ